MPGRFSGSGPPCSRPFPASLMVPSPPRATTMSMSSLCAACRPRSRAWPRYSVVTASSFISLASAWISTSRVRALVVVAAGLTTRSARMTCRVPTEWYRAQTEAGAEGETGREPRHGGAHGEGYPSGVSSEQTPTTAPDATGTRPRRLTYAAALAALEGLALVAGGVWMSVLALTGEPDDRRQAVTCGATLIVLALLPLLAAPGLLAR